MLSQLVTELHFQSICWVAWVQIPHLPKKGHLVNHKLSYVTVWNALLFNSCPNSQGLQLFQNENSFWVAIKVVKVLKCTVEQFILLRCTLNAKCKQKKPLPLKRMQTHPLKNWSEVSLHCKCFWLQGSQIIANDMNLKPFNDYF